MLSTSLLKPHNRTSILSINPRRWVSDNSASSKLFADAAREEEEEKLAPKTSRQLERQYENWTGEESMEDAVLRMLVDKYKPLRSGTIKSADERLQELAPRINAAISNSSPTLSDITSEQTDNFTLETSPTNTNFYLKDQPLLPATEGHKPWHTTFRAPTHTTPFIRYGNPAAKSFTRPIAEDEKMKKREKEERKRTLVAGRLTQARESTLDYRLGLKNGERRAQANPLTLKGWAGLVEERMENARREGRAFATKGRGQPIKRHIDEKNPFIGREEFLMNRIVQRNGAAPPWVELQGDLDNAISSFREILKQSWTRRAISTMTTDNPVQLLSRISLQEVVHLRDPEWEERERTYHDAALKEVNSSVRKYNGVAPYTVRRPYYMRSVELEKVYQECAEGIYMSLINKATERGTDRSIVGSEEDDGIVNDQTATLSPFRIRDVIREWLGKLIRRS